ncbi:MAG: hypothetical protein ACXVRP_05825 [Solirubrobacteraceae bacterium]
MQHSPGAVAKRPAGVGGDLSGLMAAAGNRAVARMVRTLQRDDYTKTVTDVEKTGISRLEVHGLKYGIDDFEARYGDKPKDVSDERHKTKESPGHMAVVLVPDTLDLDQPVQVILHFHGWGFRSFDPYAGYLIAAKDSSASAGTVRDVAQEHWEQQIASLKGQGAQVVAILAQGRGKSDFGSFPTFEYVRDVLEKSGRSELREARRGRELLRRLLGPQRRRQHEGSPDARAGRGRDGRSRRAEVPAAVQDRAPGHQQAPTGRSRRPLRGAQLGRRR